jgi:hypothetical protein
VQKSEFYSQCEDANIPAGMIPWHMACDPNDASAKCEIGSLCRKASSTGHSYCEPVPEQLVVQRDTACGRGYSSAQAAGIAFLVIGLLAALGAGGFGAPPRRKVPGLCAACSLQVTLAQCCLVRCSSPLARQRPRSDASASSSCAHASA